MSNRDIGYLIKNINDRLKTKTDADLKRYNLTFMQSRVFAFLSSRGGQATQKEIEVFLEVSHPTIVGIISRMEQNGYVTSWIDVDKRNKNVKLTNCAEAIELDLERNILASEKKLLMSLSKAEIERLREMLLVLRRNLD